VLVPKGSLAVLVLGLALGAATLGAGDVSSSKPPPLPKINVTNPCTYLTAAQVQKAFGGPVTVDPTNRGSKTPNDCGFVIGNAFTPTGVLVSTNQFPGFLVPAGESAVDVIESQRAIDAQDGLTVVDANIGKSSYLDTDRSAINVAPSTKFAFTLQWLPASAPPQGGPADPGTAKQLVALAKSVTARTPKR
jgi:hypothetical protein